MTITERKLIHGERGKQMKFINAQNVKNLAKEYGEKHREQETRVGTELLVDIDRLVEQIIYSAVRSQDDDKRQTLQSTEWLKRQIIRGEELTEATS